MTRDVTGMVISVELECGRQFIYGWQRVPRSNSSPCDLIILLITGEDAGSLHRVPTVS